MTAKKAPSPPKKITETYLKNSGLYYLQRFPASRAHFQFVMMRKINNSIKHHNSPSLEDAQRLLDRVTDSFEELGFLNDKQYALGLSRSLFNKGLSEKVIRYRLQQKGVPDHILQDAIAEVLPDDADIIGALRLLKRRRYGPFATHENKKDQQKVLGLLARSGFSYHIAQTVMELPENEIAHYMNSH